MADKLNVGIVGCGAIADKRHIPGFMKLRKNTIIQAVCDKNEGLAKDIARRYNIPKIYQSLSEMLSKESLDIVDICTPPQVHCPLAVEALEHGCHILLEKPMALKTSDCDQMLGTSHKHGGKICIVHNILFYPPLLKAKKLVGEGAIGEFIGMRIFIADPRDDMILKEDYWIHKLPGGLIGETGPHPVYISLAFLNKVNNVDIYAKNFLEHPWAPFDEFRIELEGEKAMSSVAISYTSNRRSLDIDILGTEGALHLTFPTMLLIHDKNRESVQIKSVIRYSLSTTSQIVGGVMTNAFKVLTRRVKLGHDIIIERFVNSILNDYPPPITGEEGRETTRVMEMIVKRLHEKYGGSQSD